MGGPDFAAGSQAGLTAEQSNGQGNDYTSGFYGNGGMSSLQHQRGFGIDTSPLFHYKSADIRGALERLRSLEGDPYEGVKVNLVNPVTGSPVNRTLHYSAQMIRSGEITAYKRETCNTLITVLEGSGVTEVGDAVFE